MHALVVRLLVTCVLMTAAASLPCQGTLLHLPSDDPAIGTCSTAPFGSTFANVVDRNQRWQILITSAELGGVARTISSLAFAPCGAGTHRYDRFVVTMNHNTIGLTTDMTANIGNGARTVLDFPAHVWNHAADTWVNVGLNQNFPYDPSRGDLVIQIRVTNSDFTGSVAGFHTMSRTSVLANNYSGATPRTGVIQSEAPRLRLGFGAAFVDRFGVGCGNGPLEIRWTGSTALGATASFSLGNAGPGMVPDLGAIWVGLQRTQVGVGSIGGLGCTLYASVDLSIPVVTTNGTSTALPIPIPNLTALIGGRFFVQGAHVDPPANSLGIEVSDAAIGLVGL